MREFYVAMMYLKDGTVYESRMFNKYDACKQAATEEMAKIEDAEYFVIEMRYFKC